MIDTCKFIYLKSGLDRGWREEEEEKEEEEGRRIDYRFNLG